LPGLGFVPPVLGLIIFALGWWFTTTGARNKVPGNA
jgi:hypothetical protein